MSCFRIWSTLLNIGLLVRDFVGRVVFGQVVFGRVVFGASWLSLYLDVYIDFFFFIRHFYFNFVTKLNLMKNNKITNKFSHFVP